MVDTFISSSFSIASAQSAKYPARASVISSLRLQRPSSAPAVDGYLSILNGGLFKKISRVSSPYFTACFKILNCALSASKSKLPSSFKIQGISAPTLKFFLFGGFSPPPKL